MTRKITIEIVTVEDLKALSPDSAVLVTNKLNICDVHTEIYKVEKEEDRLITGRRHTYEQHCINTGDDLYSDFENLRFREKLKEDTLTVRDLLEMYKNEPSFTPIRIDGSVVQFICDNPTDVYLIKP